MQKDASTAYQQPELWLVEASYVCAQLCPAFTPGHVDTNMDYGRLAP